MTRRRVLHELYQRNESKRGSSSVGEGVTGGGSREVGEGEGETERRVMGEAFTARLGRTFEGQTHNKYRRVTLPVDMIQRKS